MNDYTKLVEDLRGKFIAYDVTGNRNSNSAQLYKDAADAIETLQAQLPKRGEWIHGKELSRAYIGNCCVGIVYEDFRCSACGVVVKECEKPKWKYCPNCGAKMEVQDGQA